MNMTAAIKRLKKKMPWKSSTKPVQRRLLVPLAAVLLLLCGGFNFVLLAMQQENMRQSSQRVLETVSSQFNRALSDQSAALAALGQMVIEEGTRHHIIQKQDLQNLFAHYKPIFMRLREGFGITHFSFHRPDRMNLLRVHNPVKNGGRIDRFTARKAENSGKTASGIELGPHGNFILRVVQPIFHGGTRIGYLELGKEIEDILAGVHAKHGIELAVAIPKNILNRKLWEAGKAVPGQKGDWNRFPDDVLIYTSLHPFPTEAEPFVGEAGYRLRNMTAQTTFGGKLGRSCSRL